MSTTPPPSSHHLRDQTNPNHLLGRQHIAVHLYPFSRPLSKMDVRRPVQRESRYLLGFVIERKIAFAGRASSHYVKLAYWKQGDLGSNDEDDIGDNGNGAGGNEEEQRTSGLARFSKEEHTTDDGYLRKSFASPFPSDVSVLNVRKPLTLAICYLVYFQPLICSRTEAVWPSSLPSGLCTGGIGGERRRFGICTSKLIGMEGMAGTSVLPPSQFDLSLLGQFHIILAVPPWDIRLSLHTIFSPTMKCIRPFFQPSNPLAGKSVLASMGYMKVDEVVWMKTTHLQKVYRTERMRHWLNHTKEHTDDSSFQSQILPSHTFPHGSTEASTEDLVCTRNLSQARVLETSEHVQWICLGDRKLRILSGETSGRKHNVRLVWLILDCQLGPDFDEVWEDDLASKVPGKSGHGKDPGHKKSWQSRHKEAHNFTITNSTFNAAGRDIKNYYYLSTDEEKKLQDWLAAPDCSTNFATAFNQKVVGTCQWIFKESIYLEWEEKGSILWIQGKGNS
ncbi:hypothetical protein EV360DRAFT_89721 [Lentinula raphanica]|nr:hypothetical protein EV360DRAFT_89721 [Lentinula raphanica]